MPQDVSDEVLITVTTFDGSHKRAPILPKVLRHFRLKSRRPYRVLLISDEHLRTQGIDRYTDAAFGRRRSPGMYPGEMIRSGGTGWLVPCGDPEGLAGTILEALTDRTRATRMGETGRRVLEGEYPLDRMGERMERLYRVVVTEGRRTSPRNA